jgi:hypothetical protein
MGPVFERDNVPAPPGYRSHKRMNARVDVMRREPSLAQRALALRNGMFVAIFAWAAVGALIAASR